MSDMNLPTVTVRVVTTNEGTTLGVYYVGCDFDTDPAFVDPGTYALVPVDAVEKMWWCRVQDTMWPKSEEGRCHHDEEGECVTAYRWLVSAKEEE